jgi:hypothetical protein
VDIGSGDGTDLASVDRLSRADVPVVVRLGLPEERRDGNMKKALAIAVIVGFLLVDFLFFHDVFKAGEVVTLPQYLTGVLSIPVVIVSTLFLVRGNV